MTEYVNPVITRGIRKEYDSAVALRFIDLEIPPGEIYGLIGPNGAGKSTLLKILATALRADYGEAVVAGFNVEEKPVEVRRRVGYMPDFFALYESMTTEDFLTYFGLAFNLPPGSIPARVDEMLALVNLGDKRRAMISELSRGMKQRLVFAKSIIHNPALLLLDEPLSGLDPLARMEMREVLRRVRDEGKTVIVSSHVLAELTGLCTSIGILEKGVMRVSGSVDEIQSKLRGVREVIIEVAGGTDQACAAASGIPGMTFVELEGNTLRFALEGERSEIARVNAALVSAGIGVLGIREEKGSIEDIYFQISAHEVQ